MAIKESINKPEINEIKSKIIPVAKKYNVPIIYLFGSYARGEANQDSDIDLVYYGTGSKAMGSRGFSFRRELEEATGQPVDLLRIEDLEDPTNQDKKVLEEFAKDKVLLYEEA